jgi:hypothetical protein
MGIVARGAWLAAAAALFVQPARSQTPLKGAIVEGNVVDASTGRGISGARVRAQSGQDEPLFTATDEQGHFRFAGLEYRSYQVAARYPGFITSQEAGGEYGGVRVDPIRNQPNEQVRLNMQRYGAIVGKVVDPSGVPVEGAAVNALQRNPIGERNRFVYYYDGGYQYAGPLQTRTDDLGEYRIAPLAAGSYYVFVQPGSNYFPSQPAMRLLSDARERPTFYPHALKPSETKPVELAEGKELRVDVRIIRQGGVKVSGRILGVTPEDAPAASGLHVSVFVSPLSPGASSGSFGSVAGDRFAAVDLVPGKYLIEAGQYAAGDTSSENPVAAAWRTVEVATEDLEGIDLTLSPTSTVEGAVVFENGCAATPVWIQLQGDRPLGRLRRNLHAGADGRFVLQHLFPGKYKAYVRPEGPTPVYATSAKLGDAEVLADGFELTAETKGPLRITMSCARR